MYLTCFEEKPNPCLHKNQSYHCNAIFMYLINIYKLNTNRSIRHYRFTMIDNTEMLSADILMKNRCVFLKINKCIFDTVNVNYILLNDYKRNVLSGSRFRIHSKVSAVSVKHEQTL